MSAVAVTAKDGEGLREGAKSDVSYYLLKNPFDFYHEAHEDNEGLKIKR